MTQSILTNPQELETWLDDFMSEQMSKLHVPGVTFYLVQNSELFFTKGYGYANLEQQIPVVADKTLFRVGSISKLFTATAIMQLVEKELVNLNDDVNKYLRDFQLENNYPKPVTIANLLTHTAGLDDRLVGTFTSDANKLVPLGEHLAATMPKRVMLPGEVISYSNYGYALLGYVAELVSGKPFKQYVSEHILQPLEMHHSSFARPCSFANDLSIGYQYQPKDNYQAWSCQYDLIPPASSLSTTATDIAKFAIAHLQYGKYKSSRILKENTARQMQQQQFTHDSRLPGICWGFIESWYNQQLAIQHGGEMPGFTSLLYLFPNHDLGLFISSNNTSRIHKHLLEHFCDRYLPVEKSTISGKSSSGALRSLKRYRGSYRNNRYSRHTIDKTNLLGTPTLNLKVASNGSLNISNFNNPKSEYLEIKPLLLQLQTDIGERSERRFIAREENGRITALLTNIEVWERLSWYETKVFHWTLIALFLLIFLSGFVVSIFFLAKFPGTWQHQLSYLVESIVCGLNLMFLVGMLAIDPLMLEVPKKVILLLCLPLVTCVLAATLPVFAVLAWMNSEWSAIEQLYYSFVSLTALCFIPFLSYWNLLGFRY